MNRTKRFISNTSDNFLSQIWFIVLNLAVTPFVVHKLGLEVYGIFAILNVLIGYFSIMDLGIGAASIKYISDYLSKDDRESLKENLFYTISYYWILGCHNNSTINRLYHRACIPHIKTTDQHSPNGILHCRNRSCYTYAFDFFPVYINGFTTF